MAVSIVDVAAHAGVSKTTVSAVINGRQNVKAAMREKGHSAARIVPAGAACWIEKRTVRLLIDLRRKYGYHH